MALTGWSWGRRLGVVNSVEEARQMSLVTARLITRFLTVPHGAVGLAAEQAVARFAQARIRDFVP
ncbi:three-helix bundle dimerization domain-containing protein [Rhodococcus sp. NPDC127530]|uniref:three-helix bundle dimerization domain-containing protein n=1 Tax=unclassified Rhodococcus (in: high G+C Gram-positive bacteria) TaxID=192944 RepID=UPI003640E1FC